MQPFTRRSLLLNASLAAGTRLLSAATPPPAPYGPTPSAGQLQWSELEFYTFLHFTVNTFTDREWGLGDEDPKIFNPTAFDADQIVAALKDAGSRAVILTCKHHDGFCLWPTKTTEHCIRHSPYKNGKGDIVREISDAARRAGLRFGVYLSPWDRNQATYGTPRYIEVYRQQMRELLTGYGPIFEIWHDGANGGDGYYGGAREKRIIDKLHYYDWPTTWAMERQLQPKAAIFSDVGPDVRWVGNEKGIAGETCWATYTPLAPDGSEGSPGNVREKESGVGTRHGKAWMPAECDVSIRPGWFWHAAENDKVRTPENLMNLYYQSVGRGASFLLNVPPDRRGHIHENDHHSLAAFGKKLRTTFGTNYAAAGKSWASNVRNQSRQFSSAHLLDGNRSTYWSTDDETKTAVVTIFWPKPQVFDLVRLREFLPLGQRVDEFIVETRHNGQWSTFGQGTSIGLARILKSPKPVTTDHLRLRITKAAACPAVSELGVFRESA